MIEAARNNTWKDMLPLLIATTIGLSILTTNASVNFVMARSFPGSGYGGMGYGGMGYGGMGYGGMGYGGMGYGGMGYGGMGYAGAGPVIQEPVDTGNPHLDKAINKFYNCVSRTHEDPPTIKKIDICYFQTVGGVSK
jgi:hypothetical protein